MMEGTAGEGSSRRSCKLERKTIEKNRRILMKTLCFKLVSLIPDHHFKPPKELLSQQDQLEQATTYIKLLAARVEEMKRRKTQAVMTSTTANPTRSSKNNAGFMGRSKPPVVKIRELGSNLEVVLISGLCKTVMLHQVISILEQEGAEVVNVNLSNIAGQTFHCSGESFQGWCGQYENTCEDTGVDFLERIYYNSCLFPRVVLINFLYM